MLFAMSSVVGHEVQAFLGLAYYLLIEQFRRHADLPPCATSLYTYRGIRTAVVGSIDRVGREDEPSADG